MLMGKLWWHVTVEPSDLLIHVAVTADLTLILEVMCFVRTPDCCRIQGICVQRTPFSVFGATRMCLKTLISSLDWQSTDIQRIWISPLNCSLISHGCSTRCVASNCKTVELNLPANWVFTSEKVRPSPGADLKGKEDILFQQACRKT
jgi:hypothetical protein